MSIRLITAALLLCLPASAMASTLPRHSLLCLSKSEMDEAVRAIGAKDVAWLESLPTCFLTNQDVRVGLIDYDGDTVRIRFWVGGQSAIGYTLDNAIKF